VCRNCGALVGAGEAACAQCGAHLSDAAGESRAGASQQRPAYDREAVRFARAVLQRPYTFTIIFLVANLFVFLLMWSSSGLKNIALAGFQYSVLVAYGAKLNRLIDAPYHQWWRFVAPMFIHVNLLHLLVNMYSLWMVGPYVEKLYGSAKFVVFWVVTGVMGVLASYLTVRPDMQVSSLGRFLFKAEDIPSAGASGALFGLVGVLFVFGIKFRHELPEGFKRAFGTGLLPMIMLNLFIGYLGRGFIDNAAHLGGLASGAALALLVGYKRPGEPASVAVFWHILQTAALLLVAVSFMMVARHLHDPLPPFDLMEEDSSSSASSRDVANYLKAVNDGQQAFLNAFNEGDVSAINPAIKALDDAPRLDEKATALRDELKTLLLGARELAGSNEQRDQRRNTPQRKKLSSEFQAWQEKNLEWARANSKKYGLVIDEDESPPAKDSPSKK
jgi:membrane associated rhomboid family serine protease